MMDPISNRPYDFFALLNDSRWNKTPAQTCQVEIKAQPMGPFFGFTLASNPAPPEDDLEEAIWQGYKTTERREPELVMAKRQVQEMIPMLIKWLTQHGKKRDQLSGDVLNWLQYFETLRVPVVQRTACKWLCGGTVRLPEDEEKVCRAVKVAGLHHVDPMSFARPMEIIDRFGTVELREPPINPDTVPTLHLIARHKNGLSVYQVDEGEESRVNMRRIINTHFGKDCSPWCLLQGDKDGKLTKNSSWYWRYYSAYPKRVAFYLGKLVAFSANYVNRTVWWDRFDQPHAQVSITKPVEGDSLGRIANYHINLSTGKETIYGLLYRGDPYQGWYQTYESVSSLRPNLTQYHLAGIKIIHDASAWSEKQRLELVRASNWEKGLLRIPEGITGIPDNAFKECSTLTEVIMSNTVVTIGKGAFLRCSAIRAVYFSGYITALGDHCFEDCTSLQEVRIPSHTVSVGRSAFRGCTALKQAYVPDSVKEIETDAFVQCGSLQRISVPRRHYAKFVSFFGRKAVMNE